MLNALTAIWWLLRLQSAYSYVAKMATINLGPCDCCEGCPQCFSFTASGIVSIVENCSPFPAVCETCNGSYTLELQPMTIAGTECATWRDPAHFTRWVLQAPGLYVGTPDRIKLTCNAAAGTPTWQAPLGTPITASPIVLSRPSAPLACCQGPLDITITRVTCPDRKSVV